MTLRQNHLALVSNKIFNKHMKHQTRSTHPDHFCGMTSRTNTMATENKHTHTNYNTHVLPFQHRFVPNESWLMADRFGRRVFQVSDLSAFDGRVSAHRRSDGNQKIRVSILVRRIEKRQRFQGRRQATVSHKSCRQTCQHTQAKHIRPFACRVSILEREPQKRPPLQRKAAGPQSTQSCTWR